MAKVTADKCEVWVATQNGDASLAAAAGASGLPPAKCEVYKYHLGGGFGRRGMQDYITRAVQIAKQIPGVPVKLIWSREEDMRQGRFRPVGLCKMSAGLDDKGDLVGLSMRIAAPSILAYARSVAARERQGLHRLPGSQPAGCRRAVRLHHPEPADRARHAQHARAAGLLARRQQQPERHLARVLHGRAGEGGRQGPAGVPPQDDGQASQAPGRPQCGGRQDRLGQAPAGRRHARHRPVHGLRQLRRLRGRGARQRSRQGQDRPSRAVDRQRPCRQPRPGRRPRSRARSPTASAPCSTRSAR